jgi:hypothetical protein
MKYGASYCTCLKTGKVVLSNFVHIRQLSSLHYNKFNELVLLFSTLLSYFIRVMIN